MFVNIESCFVQRSKYVCNVLCKITKLHAYGLVVVIIAYKESKSRTQTLLTIYAVLTLKLFKIFFTTDAPYAVRT